MAESGAGTQFTLAGDGEPVHDDRLAQLYAYPEAIERSWVRSNFVASLDGAATADGRSGGLGGPGDRYLFAKLRELADVVIVGAGTARAENYGGVHLDATTRQDRSQRGQLEVPPVALVTRSGRLDTTMRVFGDSEVTPLVLTCTTSVPATADRLGDSAEVLDCSGHDPDAVDLDTALGLLAERDLRRVLTEGGPTLHGTLLQRGLLDELCLTVAPMMVGGQARRITTGPLGGRVAMRCAHLLTDPAGYLYTRYLRHDDQNSDGPDG
ncbi:pyrimidine reductase family protein [Mycobacterium koreense]|uniref:Uncharacterized protein n=1 Tax=Mycolicibacillus koreensis TaxID=1069220 RepID=A0A7I7SD96_9MYCO|nr:pyrimidine reductase family protein [Mycolicibacillus koreensis]MCV7246893.1 pyrimidine reductase family protein [Mycolicibacillus koreensis]ODR06944.1 hypothetical protein BHQ15_12350 [Mycolicibacillus koreensis]OSC35326.1 hypothetical protein B8W67_02705 [Mycolicibacillus koreensis]BBY54239.1 hypothetical protein MKOR_14900 [Mycolicibacillus koreensis]